MPTYIGDGRHWEWAEDGNAFLHHDGCTEPLLIELLTGENHKVVSLDPLEISPSLVCPDCGDHGFVWHGRWHQATFIGGDPKTIEEYYVRTLAL